MSVNETRAENTVAVERVPGECSEPRRNDRAGDHGRGVFDDRVVRDVSPKLAVIGRGTVAVVVYGTCLYAAAIVVGGLVGLLPGFAGAVLLFTVGVAVVGAAPSVAQSTVTRLFDFVR